MEKGIVKWFNNAKGYGFILADKSSEDIFVHYSSIDMDGYRTLRTGQEVLFEAEQGSKGLHATSIQPLGVNTDDRPGWTRAGNTGNGSASLE